MFKNSNLPFQTSYEIQEEIDIVHKRIGLLDYFYYTNHITGYH
jgi:hypothetical protein